MAAGRNGWPEDADARLRVLWEEGHSTAEIARRMGRAKNSVVGRAYRLKLPGRPTPIIATNGVAHAGRRKPTGAAAWRAAQKNRTPPAARVTAAVQAGGRRGDAPGLAAPAIPASAGIAPRGASSAGEAAGAVLGVSSLTLPPAVATRPGVFSGQDDQGCRFPLWGDNERPTHAYCGARRRRKADGTRCVYCDQHAARAFTRRAEAVEDEAPHRVTRSTFAWGGRAA